MLSVLQVLVRRGRSDIPDARLGQKGPAVMRADLKAIDGGPIAK